MQVVVAVLGRFRVVVDGTEVQEGLWRHRRAAELVMLLALAPDHRMHREQVADALWPGLALDAALPNLHKAAHHARGALGAPGAVVLRAGMVALWPDVDLQVDVERFERAADQALAHGDDRACADLAMRFPGELLGQEPYAQWAVARRERQLLRRLALLRRAGRWDEVVALDPTDEQAHREVMRRHAAAGNRLAAVRQFRRLRDVLRRELGLRPDAATLAVYEAVVAAGEPAADVPGAWPLVGREPEMLRLECAWRRAAEGPAGVVMVSGEAGVGKTRLCQELAADTEEQGWAVRQGGMPDGLIVRGEGTLVLLDDAHMADEATLRSLQDLVAWSEAQGPGGGSDGAAMAPLLVVLAFRRPVPGSALAGVRSAMLARRAATEVQLGPLTRAGSDLLIAAVVGRPPSPEESDEIFRLAAGNPFATEALGVQLGATGVVQRSPTAPGQPSTTAVDRDIAAATGGRRHARLGASYRPASPQHGF
ncbi:MAG TPA: AAA family ATPase [Euzebya sp.]|nr:AAA family ATPase [Euzebya sp.]